MTAPRPAPFTRVDEAAEAWLRAARHVADALDVAAAAAAEVPSEIGGTLLVDPSQTASRLGLDVRRVAYSRRLREPSALRSAHRTLAGWVHTAITMGLDDARLVAPRPDADSAGQALADLVARQREGALAVREAAALHGRRRP